MKHTKTLILLILSVLLVTGALCGCAAQTPEQPDASSLPQITIGSDTYPPFVYLDNNGDPTGALRRSFSYTRKEGTTTDRHESYLRGGYRR